MRINGAVIAAIFRPLVSRSLASIAGECLVKAYFGLAKATVATVVPVGKMPNGISFAALPPAQARAAQIRLDFPETGKHGEHAR